MALRRARIEKGMKRILSRRVRRHNTTQNEKSPPTGWTGSRRGSEFKRTLAAWAACGRRSTGTGATRPATGWRCGGFLLTVMTRVTGDLLLSVELRIVDVLDHRHHLPCSHLLRFLVTRSVFHVVAEIATDAEACRNAEHYAHIGILREHL